MPVRLRQVRRNSACLMSFRALIPLPSLTVSHDLRQSLLVSVARGEGLCLEPGTDTVV